MEKKISQKIFSSPQVKNRSRQKSSKLENASICRLGFLIWGEEIFFTASKKNF